MRKSCRIPEKSGHIQKKENQSGARFLGNFGTMSRDSDCLINEPVPCYDGIHVSGQKKENI